ncbi:hypothetical protein [Calothrix sp. CCY 0018]|uniref:hypothetical protein n=1 Tax=Calothrix sp. CCY 0018 TaxID=3103864 RepID=UPI0039C5EAD6
MNKKIGFWFHWDEDTTYETLKELNQVDEKIGLTNFLFTLKEILQEHWNQYQKENVN